IRVPRHAHQQAAAGEVAHVGARPQIGEVVVPRLVVLTQQGFPGAEEALGVGERGGGQGEQAEGRDAALQADSGYARAVHGRLWKLHTSSLAPCAKGATSWY